MKTLTNLISPFSTNTLHTDTYEIVEAEVINGENYKDMTVSGSLFSLTLFKGVTFDSCAFYATKFINCEFIGCNFRNCNFQFTHFVESDFRICEFQNTTWVVSSVSKSYLSTCFIDTKTSFYLMRDDNAIKDCFTSKTLTWEDVDQEADQETLAMEIDYENYTVIKKAS